MTLIGVLALCGCCPSEKEWKSPKMANVNKNRSRQKNQKVPLFFSSIPYPSPGVLRNGYLKDSRRGISD
jgi:hypothetical protein